MASEDLMRQWDAIRAKIAAGNRSSGPRDWFENVVDERDARIAELETALRVVDADIRHHLRSDDIAAALIRPHAVRAIRAALTD